MSRDTRCVLAVPVCHSTLMTAPVNREKGNHPGRGNKAKPRLDRRQLDRDGFPALPFQCYTGKKAERQVDQESVSKELSLLMNSSERGFPECA